MEDSTKSVQELIDEGYSVGIPSLSFLPARNYVFNIVKDQHAVVIPRKGTYRDLDPDFFTEKDGEYNLLTTSDTGDQVIFLPAFTKVLLGKKVYPDLTSNQIWVPVVISFKEEEVTIIGQIIEMVMAKEE